METIEKIKKSMPRNNGKPSNKKIPEQLIRERAYELYLERGATPGQEDEDWRRAETELSK